MKGSENSYAETKENILSLLLLPSLHKKPHIFSSISADDLIIGGSLPEISGKGLIVQDLLLPASSWFGTADTSSRPSAP